jgi:5-formyltetrahydrofolate cyclo-ligase
MTGEGDDLPRRKAELRREVAARIRGLGPEGLAERGARARDRLAGTDEFRLSAGLLLYAAMPDEIDAGPLIDEALERGAAVYLPVPDPDGNRMTAVRVTDRRTDLVPGRFGILEPRKGLPAAGSGEIDFVLVPGRAFDRGGRRLGRGAGFYDRFLEEAAAGAFRAALALDLQVVPEVPAGASDRPVDLVATESELIRPAGE